MDSKNSIQVDKGLVQNLKFFGIKLGPEDLENVLCKEIEFFSLKR